MNAAQNLRDMVTDRPFTAGGLAPEPRFKLHPLSSIKANTQNFWLVRGLLPLSGLAVIYGPSESGKSFLAYDVALHIADGKPWCGRSVKAGHVVYIAAEGGRGNDNRLVVAKRERQVSDNAAFSLVYAAPNLGAEGKEDALALIASIKAQIPQGERIAAIFVDTLARTMEGDENNSKDMGLYVRNVGEVAAAFECLGVVVHHTGWGSQERMRGSSALHGAADAEWSVEKNGDIKTVRIAKMKDGEGGLEWPFRLMVGEVGTDEEGLPVTSCYVEFLSEPAPPASRKKRKAAELTKDQNAFFQIVKKAIAEAGEPARATLGLPANTRVVTRANLKIWVKNGGLFDADKADSFRASVSKNITRLKGAEVVDCNEEFVWLI